MTFALLRHGETEWNRLGLLQGSSDIPLNEAGRRQAVDAAVTLRGTDWTTVVSSPLGRARETARIIAARLDVALGETYPELAERDYGPFEGTPGAEALARWPGRDYPGAESVDSVLQRGLLGMSRIATDFGHRHVIVVGHGTQLRVVLSAFAGRPLESPRNGAIAMITRNDDGWSLVSVDGEPHVGTSPSDRS